ncbi:hypothetical protein PR048_026198 [Dryococelus australis]|uniref:Uncharacterized protein n=1 Tax=Dryococelus australis TaxID=614101 RepID=A0ABQ9GKR1_9NEOP|nr:hypothetical protein PR048_026198 [Dryococelus australis]
MILQSLIVNATLRAERITRPSAGLPSPRRLGEPDRLAVKTPVVALSFPPRSVANPSRPLTAGALSDGGTGGQLWMRCGEPREVARGRRQAPPPRLDACLLPSATCQPLSSSDHRSKAWLTEQKSWQLLFISQKRPNAGNVLCKTRGLRFKGDTTWGMGATMVERLACSPPTKANRVQSRPGHRMFASGNRAVGQRVFSWISRFPPPFHSGAAPHSTQSPSSALKTSLLRAAQISSLHLGYGYSGSAGDGTRIALVGSEEANRSATVGQSLLSPHGLQADSSPVICVILLLDGKYVGYYLTPSLCARLNYVDAQFYTDAAGVFVSFAGTLTECRRRLEGGGGDYHRDRHSASHPLRSQSAINLIAPLPTCEESCMDRDVGDLWEKGERGNGVGTLPSTDYKIESYGVVWGRSQLLAKTTQAEDEPMFIWGGLKVSSGAHRLSCNHATANMVAQAYTSACEVTMEHMTITILPQGCLHHVRREGRSSPIPQYPQHLRTRKVRPKRRTELVRPIPLSGQTQGGNATNTSPFFVYGGGHAFIRVVFARLRETWVCDLHIRLSGVTPARKAAKAGGDDDRRGGFVDAPRAKRTTAITRFTHSNGGRRKHKRRVPQEKKNNTKRGHGMAWTFHRGHDSRLKASKIPQTKKRPTRYRWAHSGTAQRPTSHPDSRGSIITVRGSSCGDDITQFWALSCGPRHYAGNSCCVVLTGEGFSAQLEGIEAAGEQEIAPGVQRGEKGIDFMKTTPGARNHAKNVIFALRPCIRHESRECSAKHFEHIAEFNSARDPGISPVQEVLESQTEDEVDRSRWLERNCPTVVIHSRRLPGATVAERFDCSPPTKANRVQSPAGSLSHFCECELRRTMLLFGGFSRRSPVSRALAFQCCSIPTSFHPRCVVTPRRLDTSAACWSPLQPATDRAGPALAQLPVIHGSASRQERPVEEQRTCQQVPAPTYKHAAFITTDPAQHRHMEQALPRSIHSLPRRIPAKWHHRLTTWCRAVRQSAPDKSLDTRQSQPMRNLSLLTITNQRKVYYQPLTAEQRTFLLAGDAILPACAAGFKRTSPSAVTSDISEALLKFYFHDILPPLEPFSLRISDFPLIRIQSVKKPGIDYTWGCFASEFFSSLRLRSRLAYEVKGPWVTEKHVNRWLLLFLVHAQALCTERRAADTKGSSSGALGGCERKKKKKNIVLVMRCGGVGRTSPCLLGEINRLGGCVVNYKKPLHPVVRAPCCISSLVHACACACVCVCVLACSGERKGDVAGRAHTALNIEVFRADEGGARRSESGAASECKAEENGKPLRKPADQLKSTSDPTGDLTLFTLLGGDRKMAAVCLGARNLSYKFYFYSKSSFTLSGKVVSYSHPTGWTAHLPCRWSAGFLGDLPFPPPYNSGAAPFSPHFILIASPDLVVKSPPNLPTQLILPTSHHNKTRMYLLSLFRRCLTRPHEEHDSAVTMTLLTMEFIIFIATQRDVIDSKRFCTIKVNLLGQYQLGSPLVDDRPVINDIKCRAGSGVAWANRTMLVSKTLAKSCHRAAGYRNAVRQSAPGEQHAVANQTEDSAPHSLAKPIRETGTPASKEPPRNFPLVHTVFDTSWRTLAQSSPSTVTGDNQSKADIGKYIRLLCNLRSGGRRKRPTRRPQRTRDARCRAQTRSWAGTHACGEKPRDKSLPDGSPVSGTYNERGGEIVRTESPRLRPHIGFCLFFARRWEYVVKNDRAQQRHQLDAQNFVSHVGAGLKDHGWSDLPVSEVYTPGIRDKGIILGTVKKYFKYRWNRSWYEKSEKGKRNISTTSKREYKCMETLQKERSMSTYINVCMFRTKDEEVISMCLELTVFMKNRRFQSSFTPSPYISPEKPPERIPLGTIDNLADLMMISAESHPVPQGTASVSISYTWSMEPLSPVTRVRRKLRLFDCNMGRSRPVVDAAPCRMTRGPASWRGSADCTPRRQRRAGMPLRRVVHAIHCVLILAGVSAWRPRQTLWGEATGGQGVTADLTMVGDGDFWVNLAGAVPHRVVSSFPRPPRRLECTSVTAMQRRKIPSSLLPAPEKQYLLLRRQACNLRC